MRRVTGPIDHAAQKNAAMWGFFFVAPRVVSNAVSLSSPPGPLSVPERGNSASRRLAVFRPCAFCS